VLLLTVKVVDEYVLFIRKATCELCGHRWTYALEKQCPVCHTERWQWGKESKPGRWMRHGRTKKVRRIIHKGVRSKKQQEWAKWWASQQHYRFKPKPGEPPIYIGKRRRKRDT